MKPGSSKAPSSVFPGDAQTLATHGWCRRCKVHHGLPQAPALACATALRTKLERDENLELGPGKGVHNKGCQAPSTSSLFGEARGKMFGVLAARDRATGEPITLFAFSGQYEGRWQVQGWVGPLFDTDAWQRASEATEPRIKAISRTLDTLPLVDPQRAQLVQQRRTLSRALMVEFHALYRLHNFRGDCKRLQDAMHAGSLATGIGDCCAPKLLNAAAQRGLQPLGLAEFYWGRSNLSSTREHGIVYPACTPKCGPLLGYLLCGM